MDLFDLQCEGRIKKEGPLAARLRPKTLDEFIGQEHIAGKGTLLYRAIAADKLTSIILHGPPGTGKTTLAKIIANTTKGSFVQLNATAAGVKDIKATVDAARFDLGANGKRTILFIDEIHRFNKAQQDALLPHVEDGILVLVGATTENPYFEVNKALISRSALFELKQLNRDDVLIILNRALHDAENGLGALPIEAASEALEFFADMSCGDARAALNALELAALTTETGAESKITIDLDTARQCIQNRAVSYDKDGDSHYDTISAFIKSMRGSDPDAALYYLARMLAAGEDPVFIARRLVICASEDVGNADPHALMLAVSAMQAAQMVGMPEARIILAQAAAYVACAPKSNAALLGIMSALADVKTVGIPAHLRDAHYSGAQNLGRGLGYKYPHDYPGGFVAQQYLPNELAHKIYYNPTDNGVEKRIAEHLARLHPKKHGKGK